MTECEYCDTEYDRETGDGCPGCAEYHEQQKAYYFALFKAQRIPYTVEEVLDCYSSPPEYQKRIGALRELGL